MLNRLKRLLWFDHNRLLTYQSTEKWLKTVHYFIENVTARKSQITLVHIDTCTVWGHLEHGTIHEVCQRSRVSLWHISLHCTLHGLHYCTQFHNQQMWKCSTLICIYNSFTHARTHAHTHTPHTRPFFGDYPGSAGTRKVKPIWILLKQETVSGSSITWAICKSAPRSR